MKHLNTGESKGVRVAKPKDSLTFGTFCMEILKLDLLLKVKLKSGETESSFEAELVARMTDLVRRAAMSDDWPEMSQWIGGCMYAERMTKLILMSTNKSIRALATRARAAETDVAQAMDREMRARRELKEGRKALARKGARAKVANDPKQREKMLVRTLWNEWQGDPTRHKSQAAFVRYALHMCYHLKSAEAMERWCRDWKKERLSAKKTGD